MRHRGVNPSPQMISVPPDHLHGLALVPLPLRRCHREAPSLLLRSSSTSALVHKMGIKTRVWTIERPRYSKGNCILALSHVPRGGVGLGWVLDCTKGGSQSLCVLTVKNVTRAQKNREVMNFFCGKCVYFFFAVSHVNYTKKKHLFCGKCMYFFLAISHVNYIKKDFFAVNACNFFFQ